MQVGNLGVFRRATFDVQLVMTVSHAYTLDICSPFCFTGRDDHLLQDPASACDGRQAPRRHPCAAAGVCSRVRSFSPAALLFRVFTGCIILGTQPRARASRGIVARERPHLLKRDRGGGSQVSFPVVPGSDAVCR